MVGNKINGEREKQMEVQAEECHAPPLSRDETDELNQSWCDLVDLDNLELMQTITQLNS